MQSSAPWGVGKIDSPPETRFVIRKMLLRTLPSSLVLSIFLAGCTAPEGPATRLLKANVLPLAIDDAYQFRKIQLSSLDPSYVEIRAKNDMINFERARRTFGAVDSVEIAQRYGNYYTIFWHNSTRSDVTLRLEYRQAGLANFVMAKERLYTDTIGSHRSTFEVVGDEFLENGRVTSWRALLITDGRIVAISQSYMWR
jgi:hypothetical protein